MSSDIRSILERLALVEGTTPVNVKHGLNSQQKSVHQLPALFKPHGIKALGAKTDPQHPMHGELVGDSVEPKKPSLGEAMQEVEEDMLSKVKKDLSQYLDQLEKKVRIDRALKDKALDAVDRHEVEENDYELTDPSTVHGIEDNIDTQLGNPQQPIKVMELDDGAIFEIHGDEGNGYEIRHRGRSLPSKFKTPDEAGIAVDLFRAHRQHNRSEQDLSQDYIEER